jgi:flagellar hook-associated protein 3 FlgL
MRVTSNTFPETFKSQLQYLQQQQLVYQTQAATGLRITKPSDDPAGFSEALQLNGSQDKNNAFLNTTQSTIALATANNQAMSDLSTLITRANELAIKATNTTSGTTGLQAIGTELSSILDQVVSVANRQYNGNYLFGGTNNVPPIVQTSAGPPPTYEYNNVPTSAPPNTADTAQPGTYTSNVTQAEINAGNTINTGLVAGRSAVAGAPFGRPAFDGFLYDSGSGLDILQTLTTVRNETLAGTPATSADLQQLNQAVNLNAVFVGKTASQLSALNLNQSLLQGLMQSGSKRIDEVSSASLTDALTNLQSVQTNYQAALQSGAKVLSVTLLNYLTNS